MNNFTKAFLTFLLMTNLQAKCLKSESVGITNSDIGNLEQLITSDAFDITNYVVDKVHAGDNRLARSGSSPSWLSAVGKLNNHCSASLVGGDEEDNSRVVTTAYHCIDTYLSSGKTITIKFLTNTGKIISRTAKVLYKGDHIEDRAVLVLDRVIPSSEIAPLVLGEYDSETHTKVTVAGYSRANGIGKEGKILTYDKDCKVTQERSQLSRNDVRFKNCSAYGGASGGAVVYTEKSEWGTTHFLVGHPVRSSKTGEVVTYKYNDEYYSSDNFFAEIYDAIDTYNTYND